MVTQFSRLKLVQALLFLNAGIWVFFGAMSLLRVLNQDNPAARTVLLVILLSFGNAGILSFVGYRLGSGQYPYYRAARTIIFVNLVLTFTDQFGLVDLGILILNLVTLIILLTLHRDFRKARRQSSD